MSPRLKKFICFGIALLLLVGVSQIQKTMNRDRDALGLTRVEPLENAPPVLAFTTVALGGFRGLIANALWIRATEMQDEDKFFEMAQLADWITKLEPHFTQVWLVQSWNLAYNISVKVKENAPGDFSDRWHWVYRGIKLLRDDGLRFNPNDALIYRELGWFFYHKMGANLDDGNMYYKNQWIKEMARVFGRYDRPNLDELINPQTDDARNRRFILTNEFKMDPAIMKKVDEKYGPMEWRLPEAHAIYWAYIGLDKARLYPTKVNEEDLITLWRTTYQSMQLTVQRGRLIPDPYSGTFDFGPNIDAIPKANTAYLEAIKATPKMADHIGQAHRNFLRAAIFGLYTHNRMADANAWYQYLAEKYPNKPVIDGDYNSYPSNVTVMAFALSNIRMEMKEAMDQKNIQNVIEGFVTHSFSSLVVDEDDQAAGWKAMARQLYDAYQKNISGSRERALEIPPLPVTEQNVLNKMLDPDKGMLPEVRRKLREKLRLPPEANLTVTSTSTNRTPQGSAPPSTNAITPPK